MTNSKKDASQEPSDADLSVDRRTFLQLGVSAAAGVVVACADDGAVGVEGSETGDTGDTETGGESETSGSGDGDGDPATGDGDGDPTTGDGDGDPVDDCEGTLIDFDPEAVAYDDALFPLAVMSGEMRPNSAMFTCYIEDASPKLLRVWRPAEPGQVALIAELEVTPSDAGYAKVTVEGLCPGTWYRYAWFDGNEEPFAGRSLIGEVRTAIEENSLEPLTVVATACNGNDFDYPAFARSIEEYYDIFLHLGDMAYNDPCETLEQYRENWKLYMQTQEFQDGFGGAGMYSTWDDHEITDNSDFDRETMDPAELERRENAFQSYFELLPIDAEAPQWRLWRSFRWGLTAEFIVLDCRYERRPSQGRYMSDEQFAWLTQVLNESPCHFKVILNSVPITNMPLLWDVAANDRWEGFPAQREALLNFIDNQQIENVWFIAGDFHVCFVSYIEAMGGSLSERTREIAMSGGNSNILGDTLTLSSNFVYGRGGPRGCLLTFDPATDSVNVRFLNEDGSEDFNEDLTQD